jgi:AcrR family transcriptional regulator
MPAVRGGTYKGLSAAARQEVRRRKLLAAGLEVFGTEGIAAATVRAICREARLTSRFFYESFESVEEVACALFDDILDRSSLSVLAAVEGLPSGDHERRMRIAIETFVKELTEDRRVARFVLMEALGSSSLIERRVGMVRLTAEALALSERAAPPTERSESYREVVGTVLVGGFVELLVAWLNDGFEADLERIVDDYVQLVLGVGRFSYAS